MKPLPILAALLAATAISCQKAHDLANKARTAVEAELAKVDDGDKPDSALEKLVDRTGEGVFFRKDLAFPKHLDVTTTRRVELDVRTSETSALGSESGTTKAIETNVNRLERDGDRVRYTLVKSTTAAPDVAGTDQAVKPVESMLAPPSKPRLFLKSGGKWQIAADQGFRGAALSRDLAPVFDELLASYGLAPRPLWFGKKRMKIGDKLTVAGASLPMLISGAASGSLAMELVAFEPVNGHPCGVFTVAGDFSRKNFADFEGVFSDEEVTIRSGKFWLSLLYPVILREEADTIRTFKSGSRGGPISRAQGKVGVSVIRDWKILAPGNPPK